MNNILANGRASFVFPGSRLQEMKTLAAASHSYSFNFSWKIPCHVLVRAAQLHYAPEVELNASGALDAGLDWRAKKGEPRVVVSREIDQVVGALLGSFGEPIRAEPPGRARTSHLEFRSASQQGHRPASFVAGAAP